MLLARNRHLVIATSAFFIAGNALFATSLAMAPAALILAGCAGAIWTVWTCRGADEETFLEKPLDMGFFAACVAIALTVFVLSGEGHIFYSNIDWLTRDAVLADVVKYGFASVYRFENETYMLRAPLGMYAIPAVVGWFVGLHAAHFALLAQNSILLAAILYMLGALAPDHRRSVIGLFLLFGGANFLPTLYHAIQETRNGTPFEIPQHIDNWNSWFSYSSNATLAFWVPNHALPGWWLAALCLHFTRRRIDLATLIGSVAPAMLWSPLAILFMPVALIYFALRSPSKTIGDVRNWIAVCAGCAFIPVAIYLTAGSETIDSGWLIVVPGFLAMYALFIVVEMPHVATILAYWRMTDARDRGLFAVCLAFLLVIPVYTFGPFNDLALRGTIGPLMIVSFVFSSIVTRLDARAQPIGRLVATLIIAVGGFSVVFEVMRGLTHHRYAISDCNLMSAWYDNDHSALPTNYVARGEKMPGFLLRAGALDNASPFEERSCWPDHPMPEESHKQYDGPIRRP